MFNIVFTGCLLYLLLAPLVIRVRGRCPARLGRPIGLGEAARSRHIFRVADTFVASTTYFLRIRQSFSFLFYTSDAADDETIVDIGDLLRPHDTVHT